jgi:lysophospholipase L1-like esterase
MRRLIFAIILCSFLSVSAQQNECEEVKKKLAGAEKKLNDWAELNRYAEAGKQTLPPKMGESRVVFIGDSITDLWDEAGFGGFFPGKPYFNRGISGQTTPQMLLRFRQDVINLHPKAVVILAGTNDISGNTGPMTLEQTGANIASMAELATANGIKVVLSSVLPVSDTVKKENGEFFIQTKRRPPDKILEMNEWLKKHAAQNRYIYLDYFSAMVDENGFIKDGITFDGLHPNKEGYAIMNPLAEDAIKRALKSKK